jgi:hypothetical protein
MSADTVSNRRWMMVLCWLTAMWAAFLVFVCLHKNHGFVYDDTFITLRYARHLIEGLGPRWNRAGAPVEGFSSPLHLLLIAALGKLGMQLLTAARVLGFASHVALAGFVGWFVGKTVRPFAGMLAAALIATSWPMLTWDLGGLDEILFTAFLTAGALVTLRYIETGSRQEILIGGLLLGVAVLVRPDGGLIAAVSLLACLGLGRERRRVRLANVLLAGCIAAAVVLPWEIFRLAYYHAALPNTYYAKVYGIPLSWRVLSGLEYWRVYARNPPYLAVIAFLMAMGVLLKRRVTRFDWGLWACIVAYALYIVTSGGDHMMAFRFMIPLVPLLAVVVARGVSELGALNTAWTAAAVSVVLFAVSARQAVPMVENPIKTDYAGSVGEQVANYINGHWPTGSWIAVNTAGTTAYFADEMNYIDMLGLNDREIARRKPVPMYAKTVRLIGHMKGDGASVLARRPEFIIANYPFGMVLRVDDPAPYFVTEYELVRAPEFAELYEACRAMIPVSDRARELHPELPKQMALTYYQRRDLQVPCTPAR